MRTILLLTILLSRLDVTGQSLSEWHSLTDSIFNSITAPADQKAFKEIITKRERLIKNGLLDTTFNFIRVLEIYDTRTTKSNVTFDYVADDDKDYLLKNWTYQPIDSIKPRNYNFDLGCITRNRHKHKINRWKKRIEQENTTKETYYIIDTLFDKSTNTVRVSFKIPITGQRGLEATYGPFGKSKRPYLRTWD